MPKFNSLFRPIDELIFKAVDEIKGQPQLAKLTDELAALPEAQQKVINQLFSSILVLLPLIIVIILFNQNANQKTNIATKQEIIRLITDTNQKSNEIALSSRHIVGSGVINNMSDLQRLVRSSLTSKGATPDAVTITEFDQVNAGDSLTRTVATLNFSNLSTQNFTGLLQDLLSQQKMKVSAIQIEKRGEQKLLHGSFEIYHFSKLGE